MHTIQHTTQENSMGIFLGLFVGITIAVLLLMGVESFGVLTKGTEQNFPVENQVRAP